MPGASADVKPDGKTSDAIDAKEELPLLPGTKETEGLDDTCGVQIRVPRDLILLSVGVFCMRNCFDSFGSMGIKYYTKDKLHMSPSMATMLPQLVAIAWQFKPVWGYISDTYPLLGFHRITYITAGLLLAALAQFAIFVGPISTPYYASFAATVQLGVCFTFIGGEALLAEQSKGLKMAQANKMLTLAFATGSVGSLVGGGIGGQIAANLGYHWVFGLLVFIPLIALWFVWRPTLERPRPPEESTRTCAETFSALWGVFSDPMMYSLAIFLFVSNLRPSMGAASFYYYTNYLKIDEEWMAIISWTDSVFGLIGFGLYYVFFTTYSPRWMMFWGTLATTLITSTQLLLYTRLNLVLGIHDVLFLFVDDIIVQTIANVLACPLLSIIAQVCPKGLEGTVFCTFTTIYNFGIVGSAAISGYLVDAFGITEKNFDNVIPLRILTLALALMPCALVWMLPSKERLDSLNLIENPAPLQEVSSHNPESTDYPVRPAGTASCCVMS